MRARTLRLMMFDAEDRQLEVVVRWTPEVPDRGPDFSCAGGYPGEPETVEIEEVQAVDEGADVEWPENHEDEVMETARIEAESLAEVEDDLAYEIQRDREAP